MLLKHKTKRSGRKQFSENRLCSNNLFTLLCCCDVTRSDKAVRYGIESSLSGGFCPSLMSHKKTYFLNAFIHFRFWKTSSEVYPCYVPWNMRIKSAIWGNFRIINVARNPLKACSPSKCSSLQKWAFERKQVGRGRWPQHQYYDVGLWIFCFWRAFSLVHSSCIPHFVV